MANVSLFLNFACQLRFVCLPDRGVSSCPAHTMLEPMQKTTEDFQKMGKDNYDAMLRAYGEVNKGLQAIAARWTDFPSALSRKRHAHGRR